MLESFVESQTRTIRGNRVLIALRLLLATVSLAILLLHERGTLTAGLGWMRGAVKGGDVLCVAFSRDGQRLYSGGSDGTIRLWDIEAGAEAVPALEGHRDEVTALALHPSAMLLASASMDHTVRLWNAANGQWQATLPEHADAVTCLSWSRDGAWLMSGGLDNPLRIWALPQGAEAVNLGPASRRATFAAFLPSGREVVAAFFDGHLRVFNVATRELVLDLTAHDRPITAAALSEDGRSLMTAGSALRLWNTSDWKETRVFEPGGERVAALALSREGRLCLSASSHSRLQLWSLEQAGVRREFGAHEGEVWAAALAPDARWAATGSSDRIVRIWDVETGKPYRIMAGHRPALSAALHSRDAGHRLPLEPLPLYGRPEGLVVVIVCLLTILYTLALRRSELAPKLAYLQIAVDVGLISALVYHTGGVDSPFVTLYLVSIVAAAFVLSWRAAILTAAVAAILFSLLTLAYGLGRIPPTYALQVGDAQLKKFGNLDLLDYLRLLLLPVCAFFLIAVLSGNLGRRLAIARLLHREVLDGIGEGVLVAGSQREVLYHNREFEKLLPADAPPERRSVRALLGEAVDNLAEKVQADGKPRRLEVTTRRPDGSLVPFAVRILPVAEEGEGARGLILVLDDITAEKKMEEFFKHKERIETMGQISATIAHEIRNPLASIRGAVQEIARSVPIPEGKKVLLDIVLSESDRLDQIITDFLRYARMRAPKLSPVDLIQLLGDLRLLLLARPEARTAQIVLEAPDDLQPFAADAEQLRQIFLNLGVNALQAVENCPEKRVLFRVKPATRMDAQGHQGGVLASGLDRSGVLIQVQDTGCGISEKTRKQIFEPFFTTKPNGTGLGLAIVGRIVQSHDGMVKLTSREGAGATFEIWLPTDLMAETAPADETLAPTRAAGS